MKITERIFNKQWKIDLLLFLCSFCIYFVYFHPVFLNINSVLSSITLDSLKNYYTFVYHIKNDPEALNFSGMNFPFGEHVIYTDCQPVFTFILRLFPFTYNYLIGIMHGLMFFSFIVTPVILNKILRRLEIDTFSAFFISLAIALLSPQFLKINAGHFALAYGCIFPMAILLTLNYLKKKNRLSLMYLFLFDTILFLLHPYLAFCCSTFCILTLLFSGLPKINKAAFLKTLIAVAFAGLLPIFLFKVFMLLTDQHHNRTIEPFGAGLMIENLDSLLSPVFGPFKSFMEIFFNKRPQHYEGHTYLGFFTILSSVAFLLLLPFTFRKLKFKKEIVAAFFASFVLLLVAFGVHLDILTFIDVKSSSVNQFRAVCRFAWIFYFTLPLFLVVVFYHSFKTLIAEKRFYFFAKTFSLLFLLLNLTETHYFFKLDESAYWKFRNFFNKDILNPEETMVLKTLEDSAPQAILPLPIFHGGSEMYDRLGSSNSMRPTMMYSYHSGIPILSVMLSRTSITETEDLIQLLNSYKKEKNINALLGKGDFFVITTQDPLLPDEERLAKKVSQSSQNDSLKFGFISKNKLLERKLDPETFLIDLYSKHEPDSNGVLFIPKENKKPFTTANINDFETICVLDSNRLETGNYIVSFHYHYTKRTYHSVACGLIVTKARGKDSEWLHDIPVRYLSGFYDGYGIFEYQINLAKENKYEFILKGYIDQNYRISDFMLRPANKTVWGITQKRDTVFNNFPE